MTDPVDRYPLVLVPGMMATGLKYGSTSVWPVRSPFGLRALRRARPVDFRPTEVLRKVRTLPLLPAHDMWGGFIDQVLQSSRLAYREGESWFPFAYNWADDIRNSAEELSRFIDDRAAELGDDTAPDGTPRVRFVVVAHNLGALVARWYVEKLDGHRRVARLVLAGAVDRGTPAAFLTLNSGELWPERLGRAGWDLRLFDRLVDLLLRDRMGMLRGVPSLYQLLPDEAFVATQAGAVDVLSDDGWLRRADDTVAASQRGLLEDARRVRAALSLPPRVPTTYVYGTGESTPTDFFVPTQPSGRTDWSQLKTNWGVGDGFVLARAAHAADWGADVEVEWIAGLHSDFLTDPRLAAVLDRVTRRPAALGTASANVDAIAERLLDTIEFSAHLRAAGLDSCAAVQLARAASGLDDDEAAETPVGASTRLGDLHPRDVLDPVVAMEPGSVVVLMGDCDGVDLAAHLSWRLAWARRGAGHGLVPLRVDVADDDAFAELVARELGRQGRSTAGDDEAKRFLDGDGRVLLVEGWVERLERLAEVLTLHPTVRLVLIDRQRQFDPALPGVEALRRPRVYGFPRYRRTVELYLALSGRGTGGGAAGVWVGVGDPGVASRPLATVAPNALMRSATVTVDWPLDLRTGQPRPAEFAFEVDVDGDSRSDWGGTLSPDDGVNRELDVGLQAADTLDHDRIEARFFYRQRRVAALDLDLRLWRTPDAAAEGWLSPLWLDRVIHAALDAGLVGAWGLNEGLAALPETLRESLAASAEGAPRERWRTVLLALNRRAPDEEGRVALAAWLGALVRMAGGGSQGEVLAKALELVVGPAPGTDAVTDAHVDALDDLPEAFVLGDDLVPFRFLEHAMRAGRAVARLQVPLFDHGQERVDEGAASGTGWLITPDVLVTNFHVVAARPGRPGFAPEADIRRQVAATTARFHFEELDGDGVDIRAKRLLFSDPDLDVALVELQRAPDGVTPLTLSPVALRYSDEFPIRVNIIQHPLGGPKRVGLRDNLVLAARDSDELVYLTDTTVGSSGSPVLDDQWRVVGLHRAARRVNRQVRGKTVVQVNVGIQLEAVRRVVHGYDRALCARVFGSRCREAH